MASRYRSRRVVVELQFARSSDVLPQVSLQQPQAALFALRFPAVVDRGMTRGNITAPRVFARVIR